MNLDETAIQHIIRWTHQTDLKQMSIYILGEWMDDLIPFEKQIIKRAFNAGREEMLKVPGERKFLTAENFYNETFKRFS